MAEISKKQIDKALQQAESMKSRAMKYKEQGQFVIGRVVNTVLGFGVSYGLGVAEGYHDGLEYQGVAGSVIVAGFAALGAIVFDGGARDHALTIMDAALWSYGHALGIGTGKELKKKHDERAASEGGAGQHALPPAQGQHLPAPAPAKPPAANAQKGMEVGTRLE